jgi:uncharacterized protein
MNLNKRMKIFLDIGHPAHVHYFKHTILSLIGNGDDIFITARNKEVTLELLKYYGIQYYNRGEGGNSTLEKFIYLIKANTELFKLAKQFKPELFLSFASPYAAQVSSMLRVPHLAFDDTEHAVFAHKLYRPFSDKVFVPTFYKGKIGRNVFKYKGLIELTYLHPDYFMPIQGIRQHLKLKPNEKFSLVRFVSWNANHDMGHKGISYQEKIDLVEFLHKYGKVFISSEVTLPKELEVYRIEIEPYMMHSVLSEANIYVGESGTMATEAALLATPSVNVSTSASEIGVFQEIEKYGLMSICSNYDEAVNSIEVYLKSKKNGEDFYSKRDTFISTLIDVNDFIMKEIDKYRL